MQASIPDGATNAGTGWRGEGKPNVWGAESMRLPFLGSWVCTIDEKRRLTLPAKFRELLAMEETPYLVTTLGFGGCLFLVPQARWDELTPAVLRTAFQDDSEAVLLRATFARYGHLCRMDNSGRITLTDQQTEVAHLDRQAVVSGNYTLIEIWNPERFESRNPRIADTAEHDRRIMRYMGTLGGAGGRQA
jgi:MraZ protein